MAGVSCHCCVVYLDDLDHQTLRWYCSIFRWSSLPSAAGLRLNPKNCHLLRRETVFLGHVVSAAGVTTDQAKVAAVKKWPVSKNIAEMENFLDLVSNYQCFVQNFSNIGSPLHQLTEKGHSFVWNEACEATFKHLREVLTKALVLAYPDAGQLFIIDTDGSNVGIGTVLSQDGDNGEHIIAYFLSRCPCKVIDCHNCRKQEEREK